MRRWAFWAVGAALTVTSTVGVLAACDGCNASAQQIQGTVTDGISLAGCILAKVLTGVVDVASLLGCGGATEAFIVDVIDDFTAQRVTDAGLAAVGTSLTPQQLTWIQQARTNAVAALAAKHHEK